MHRALRVFVAATAAALLALLALCLSSWHGSSYPAVVKAARVLELASTSPGRYQLTLRDGRPPAGRALLQQRQLLFERSELVEVTLEPGLVSGAKIDAGGPLASVRSTKVEHREAELEAQRRALEAERALLLAGSRPEEVTLAETRVQLARAQRQAEQAELDRTRVLAGQGLVSAVDLQVSQLEDEVQRVQIELASQGVDVARSPARPEALAAVDAKISALEASLAELDGRHQEEAVTAPFAGLVELGGRGVELRLLDVDTVYLSFLLPEAHRRHVAPGSALVFTSHLIDGSFPGRVHAISDAATVVNACPFLWVSVEVPNPGHVLRDGMIGTVELRRPSPAARSLLARIGDILRGKGP